MNGRPPIPSPSPVRPTGTRRAWLADLARALLLVGTLLTPGSIPSARAAAAPSEYEVKAVLLFNFLKFTEWPADAFSDATSPLVIGVVGTNPFGRLLEDLVKDEAIDRRAIVIRHFGEGEVPTPCHALFIGRSEEPRLPTLLEALRDKPVLTLSDLERFCQRGGMVNLTLTLARTVRPEVSPAAARAARLAISSRLLGLPSMRIVSPETPTR